jgi:hypothetical protein
VLFSEILHLFFQEQLINYRDQKFGRSSKFLVVTDMDIPGHCEFGRRGNSRVEIVGEAEMRRLSAERCVGKNSDGKFCFQSASAVVFCALQHEHKTI